MISLDCCFFLSELLNIPLKDVKVFIGEEGIVTYNIRSTDYDTVYETTTASFQNTLNNMGGSGISVSDVQIDQDIVAKIVSKYYILYKQQL
jgi:hypothetical protein